jgi:hypothetical protein
MQLAALADKLDSSRSQPTPTRHPILCWPTACHCRTQPT